jgi:tripartite motif-containing protein 71
VTDRDNGRIPVYDLEGKFLFCFGEEGDEPGQLEDPIQTVFDKEGRLWVCDRDNHRLSVFTADGKFLKIAQESPAGTLSGRPTPYGRRYYRFSPTQ